MLLVFDFLLDLGVTEILECDSAWRQTDYISAASQLLDKQDNSKTAWSRLVTSGVAIVNVTWVGLQVSSQ